MSFKKACVLLVPLSGFLIACIAFYPGFMSYDSVLQYSQAITFKFHDSHPPIMALLWSFLNLFFDGPQGLLFFHQILLWTGLYLLYDHFKKQNHYSIIILFIGFSPWIINFSGVLWKDIGMSYALLTAVALILGRPNLIKFIVATMLIFYSLNVRHNAIFAVTPILYFIIKNRFRHLSKLQVIMALAAVVFLNFFIIHIVNYHIIKASKGDLEKVTMFDDLSYFSLKNKKSLLPGIPFKNIQSCSTYHISHSRLVSKWRCFRLRGYKAPMPDEMRYIWIRQVLNAPIDYALFRLSIFSYFLRSNVSDPYCISYFEVMHNNLGIKHTPNYLTRVVSKFIKNFSSNFPFLFKPYFWLFLNLVIFLLVFGIKRTRVKDLIYYLNISSIFYMLGYAPTTAAADFRYAYWSVLATSVSAVLLLINVKPVRLKTRLFVKKNIPLCVLIITLSAVLFNMHKIFNINMDKLLLQSIESKEIPIISDQKLIGLNKEGKSTYLITDKSPKIIFDILNKDLSLRNIRFIKFNFSCFGLDENPESDFSCFGLNKNPRLKISWRANSQSKFTSKQSRDILAFNGENIIVMPNDKLFSNIGQMQGLQIQLDNLNACGKIKIEGLFIYPVQTTTPCIEKGTCG